MVGFQVFFTFFKGIDSSVGEAIDTFFQLSLGGVAVGLLAGLICYILMSTIRDSISQVVLTVVLTYMSFYVSEYYCDVSGVITLVTYGIVLSSFESMKSDEEKIMNHFWEVFSYMANTVIFVITGAIIMKQSFLDESIDGYDWLYLILFFLFINVLRFAMVGVL